jgi:hypothetical protein
VEILGGVHDMTIISKHDWVFLRLKMVFAQVKTFLERREGEPRERTTRIVMAARTRKEAQRRDGPPGFRVGLAAAMPVMAEASSQ